MTPTRIRHFHVAGLTDSYLRLELTDEWGRLFTTDLDLDQSEFVSAAIDHYVENCRRKNAGRRCPQLEAEVASAIERIQKGPASS